MRPLPAPLRHLTLFNTCALWSQIQSFQKLNFSFPYSTFIVFQLYIHTSVCHFCFFFKFLFTGILCCLPLCLAVNSLPLVLRLLCLTQASDPSSSSYNSKMDGIHFKLLYHGEAKRCCWQVILPTALIQYHTQLIYISNSIQSNKCPTLEANSVKCKLSYTHKYCHTGTYMLHYRHIIIQ